MPRVLVIEDDETTAREIIAELSVHGMLAEWVANGRDGLAQALQKLDQRSRDIIQRRWLNDDKATLQDLADEYGVSAERIRQVEANAMKKMRGLFAA